MKSAIISPHTDDAIFSLGSTIPSLGDVTIISPFAGIPDDEAGKLKHTTLRREHDEACRRMGVKYINGDFLDDVYESSRDLTDLVDWLEDVATKFSNVYIPLGIHHPDHLIIRTAYDLHSNLYKTGYYEELPYRELYLDEAMSRARNIGDNNISFILQEHTTSKEHAVEAYESQIIGRHILPYLYVTERIWTL